MRRPYSPVVVAGSVGCDSAATHDGAAYADRLQSAVSTDAVMAHLRELQDIANRNGGTRQTGTPGYSASVDYVVKALEDKGFDVQTPEFELGIFHVNAESLTIGGAPVAARAVEYSGATSAQGVTGPLVVVPENDSPGCEPADYDGLPIAGAVVLVDRGGCYLSDKAAAASGRGATGLIIANDVEEKAFSAALLEDDHVRIPVASVSKADGAQLRTRTGNATLVVDARTEHVRAKNVVAQTTTGSAQDVVLVGAHLDSAVSSTAATPEPLSLIPGPSRTLSRCAPTSTTSCAEPVVVWATTFLARTRSVRASTTRVALPVRVRSCAPSALLTLATGILTWSSSSSAALNAFSSTSLAMINPVAPRPDAAAALSDR